MSLSTEKSAVISPLDPEELDDILLKLDLSAQQGRIVALLLQGMSDKEIALEMGLKISTVRTYLERLFARLGVEDRLQIVLLILAIHNGRCEWDGCPQKC